MGHFKKVGVMLLPAIVAALNILIIIFPRESLAAARTGLELWAHSVLPGVLPFVIGANLLMALGAVGFFGAALAPGMRAVFRVPGTGGFALAIGLISGYPVGAKVVGEMRARGELTRVQAQRLAAFTNNAGPLFILGAVAAGMFGSAALGYFMLAVHYLGGLAVGLCMRFYGRREEGAVPVSPRSAQPWHRSNQSFGQIFGRAVLNAVETMLLIGGFIVLFSVISTLLELSGVYAAISGLFAPLLRALGIPQALHAGLFTGIVEMTNGVSVLSQQGISRGVVALASAIISFGGLSILFQSINFLGKTDINVPVYIACKIAHGVFAGVFAILLHPFFAEALENPATIAVYSHTAVTRFVQSGMYFGLIVASLGALALCVLAFRAIKKGRAKLT
ncbi:MAG: sporulation integral membrane protein YlbJ [Defluviitaleaceae bacterium]|nr:sporulation integral membrane protein YlbJ [Defluviitaleaceae bacterium]